MWSDPYLVIFIDMGFNIKKYENTHFHDDELIQKRVRALMTWYDYQIFKDELGLERQIVLINSMIDTFIGKEWYEIADFFKKRREEIKNNVDLN